MDLKQSNTNEGAPGPGRGPSPPSRVRTGVSLLMCGAAALLASGCALSVPMAGLVSDPTPTGTIERGASVLSRDLDQEDWRRAKAALAVALDPQGNGAMSAWANPATGAKGSFTAAALPRPEGDRICRAFHARVTASGGSEREMAGSACRDGSGEWTVAKVADSKKAAS